MDLYVHLGMEHFPIAESHLSQIAKFQDEVCKQIKQYSLNGWLARLHGQAKLCQPESAESTLQDGLLMKDCRIMITTQLR